MSTYLDRDRLPYPFCPGCSHGEVLDRIDEALVRLQPDRKEVVIVTDIGCMGLSDQWFATHAFHGLHGRSVVYGQGLKLASPNLHVIVLMGDGGAGIGLHHLLNAAKRNVGISVVLFNNMNFGMTGGEHSVTTPEGSVTSTTPARHFERPLQLSETLHTNFAPFVARRAYYDEDLADVLAKAIAFDGFSFVEVMEFCTAYYVPFNKFSKKDMEQILDRSLPRMTHVDESRVEYSKEYRSYCRRLENGAQGTPLEPAFEHSLCDELDIVIAGSAGMKISSTATLLSRAAILAGLQALQRDDYPVTVRTGHSVSIVKLSEKTIVQAGAGTPDVLLLLSNDGLKQARRYLEHMRKPQRVYALSTLPELDTGAEVIPVDLGKLEHRVPKEGVALSAVSAFLRREGILPLESLLTAIQRSREGAIADRQSDFVTRATAAVFEPRTFTR